MPFAVKEIITVIFIDDSALHVTGKMLLQLNQTFCETRHALFHLLCAEKAAITLFYIFFSFPYFLSARASITRRRN
jgi:hypothetical protein